MVRAAGFEFGTEPSKIKGCSVRTHEIAEILTRWPHLPRPFRAGILLLIRALAESTPTKKM